MEISKSNSPSSFILFPEDAGMQGDAVLPQGQVDSQTESKSQKLGLTFLNNCHWSAEHERKPNPLTVKQL